METTPLLRSKAAPTKINSKFFMLSCLIVATFIEIGSFTLLIPQVRIYESILCNQHYNDGRTQIPEDECKLPSIQGELAKIRAISTSITAIPGLLLSVPYGQLADNPKYGRKLVLIISYVGTLLQTYTELLVPWLASRDASISLRLVWLAPAWTILGGGAGTVTAALYTMITDVVDIDQRSTGFIYISLSLQISQLVAPVIASWLMDISPWVAYAASSVLLTIGLPAMMLCIPETINVHRAPDESTHLADSPDESEYDERDEEEEEYLSESSASSSGSSRPASTAASSIDGSQTTKIGQAVRGYRFLKSWSVLVLLSSFCLFWVGRSQMDLLVQYISARYGHSISSAGFVMSMNAALSLVLLLILIPLLKTYLQTRWRLSGAATDLWLLKTSIVLLTLGSIGIGAAPVLSAMLVGDAIYVLGGGFSPLVRGLLTLYVDKLHIARLQALIAIVQMLGMFLGSPILALLFDWGFSVGREWTGLPFLGSGALHVLICLAIWAVRLPLVAAT